MAFKNIPVSVATQILEDYLKDEVILITYDEEGGFTFTTDGSTETHKQNASNGAQHLIKQLEKSGVIGREGQIKEDPNNRLILERLKEYLRIRALQKKSISKYEIEIMGPMIPVNEVIGLLEGYQSGELKQHMDRYDELAPERWQTTSIHPPEEQWRTTKKMQ